MDERLSFYFYCSWESQIDIMDDNELRRFIKNLINWHKGKELNLPNKTDKFIWQGVLPAIELNDKKWRQKAETSRENGRQGGRPNKKDNNQITQQVIIEPGKPVNSKEEMVNSELLRGNCEKEIVEGELLRDNCEKEIVESKSETVPTGQSTYSFFKNKIKKVEDEIINEFPQYPFLIDMANPSGIKELKNHIDNKVELDRITKKLVELSKLYTTSR